MWLLLRFPRPQWLLLLLLLLLLCWLWRRVRVRVVGRYPRRRLRRRLRRRRRGKARAVNVHLRPAKQHLPPLLARRDSPGALLQRLAKLPRRRREPVLHRQRHALHVLRRAARDQRLRASTLRTFLSPLKALRFAWVDGGSTASSGGGSGP